MGNISMNLSFLTYFLSLSTRKGLEVMRRPTVISTPCTQIVSVNTISSKRNQDSPREITNFTSEAGNVCYEPGSPHQQI